MNTVRALKMVKKNVKDTVESVLTESGGLLRLAPCCGAKIVSTTGQTIEASS